VPGTLRDDHVDRENDLDTLGSASARTRGPDHVAFARLFDRALPWARRNVPRHPAEDENVNLREELVEDLELA
jgi:hypothetical protein